MNRPFSQKVVAQGAALVLCAAVLLDAFGVALGAEPVWRVGGMLGWPAFGSAVLGGVLLLRTRVGALRALLLLLGLALFALARWLRGSAGVPPDPPLLVAGIASIALYAAALLPRRAP